MDKKTFAIGVLSVTAVMLFVANLFVAQPRAMAEQVIKDRDYQALTARWQANDDALYILDNRTGMMAAFVYDPNQRAMVARARAPVMDAFGGGNVR